MDTRRLITALFAAIAVFYLYVLVASYLFPPPPEQEGEGEEVAVPVTSQPGDVVTTMPGVASRPATGPAPTPRGLADEARVSSGERTSAVVLGDSSDDSPYPMRLEILPAGATVARVSIRGHYDTVDRKQPYPIIEPVALDDVREGDQPILLISLQCADDLEAGTVPDMLRSGLDSVRAELTAEPALTDKATVVAIESGKRWLISDSGRYYLVSRESGRLGVYHAPLAHSFTTWMRFENLNLNVSALKDTIWTVTEESSDRVVFSADVFDPKDGRVLARVFKTYELKPQPTDAHTYDVFLSVQIENLSGDKLSTIVKQQGAVGFRKEEPRRDDRTVVRALWEVGATEVKLKKNERKNVVGKGVTNLGGDDQTGNRIAWMVVGNKYFGCIMAPAGRKSASSPAQFVRAEAVCLADDIEDASQMERQDMTFQYITYPLDISAGDSTEVAFDCYVGPESKRSFESVSAYRDRDYFAVIRANFYFCAPAWLVGVMMALMDSIHGLWPNYGIAIIVLVVVVRAAMHPITRKSQINMLKMQKNQAKLKPKLDALKAKYGNDRAKLNQATMAMYKEEGVNPAGQMLNCLPMMLQVPIWGALFMALSYTIEMRHAPFDGWWIKDLARPDALFAFSHPVTIPLLGYLMGGPIETFNLLPLLLGVTQLLQARFMPKSSGAPKAEGAPDQVSQQRKMMMFMSVFFIFIFYNMPSGLTLYIMASNLFGIVEQWRIRKHLADLEAKGIAINGPRRRKRDPGKKGWLQQKWEHLQKQADEARRIQGPRGRDGDRRR